MKGIFATVICAVAAIYAATVFAENAAKEPEKKDFTPEFVAQCRARAEAGDADGMVNYGCALFYGWGVEKDMAKAVEWYTKAAVQGDAYAQLCLGMQYANGEGVEKDMAKAAEWLGKASLQGNGRAVNILGEILDNHDFDSDIRANRETYEAALRVGREKLEKRWPKQRAKADARGWTTNETEKFWASAASSATRIVTAPRMEKADAQKGEGMLEAFGTQYLPSAYDNYEKVRAKAIEREQLLREKFPEGAKSDTTGGGLYQKIAKATAKAISEYYRRHDELCHFYLMHKAGIMTDAELAELDESKISVMLPLAGKMPEAWSKPDAPKPGELDFARKYKAETFAAYERLKAIYDEGVKQYRSLLDDAIVLDAVRCGGVLAPLAARLAEVSGKLQGIAKTLSEENLLHEVEEVTAEQLADSDSKFGIAIRAFEKTLPVRDYAKNWLAKNWTEKKWGSIAFKEGAPLLGFGLAGTMVPIPGKDYSICKYEVTQALWEAVMGENPSNFKGADRPVENVSWNDCQKFLEKLNGLPEVKASGKTYRLPTADEWEFACRAGATGDYCKLADGTEITRETLGEVAWYGGYSKIDGPSQTHPVGQKKPNAFGLYDMHGNVWEWTSTADGSRRVFCGGSWDYSAGCCKVGLRGRNAPGSRSCNLGFRLTTDK